MFFFVTFLKILSNKYFVGRLKTPTPGLSKPSMRYYTPGL